MLLTIEERSSAQDEVVSDIRIWLLAARVVHHVPLNLGSHQVPLPIGHVVTQVRGVPRVDQIHLESIISPACELHCAFLFVKWEIFHIDCAGRLENCWAEPGHISISGDYGISAGHPRVVLPVSIVVKDDVWFPDCLCWQSDHRDVLLGRGVPDEVGVVPLQGEPAVGGQHLVPLVLEGNLTPL